MVRNIFITKKADNVATCREHKTPGQKQIRSSFRDIRFKITAIEEISRDRPSFAPREIVGGPLMV